MSLPFGKISNLQPSALWILALLSACAFVMGGTTLGASASAAPSSKKTLRVLINGNGLPVYSDESSVQGLETVLAAVLGQLVYASDKFDLQPGLLSSFRWDFEKKLYMLELRDGVTFHNGRLATSQDLEFSLLRGLLSKKGTWFKSFFANVEGIQKIEGKTKYKTGMVPGIRVIDSRRVTIKLKAPNPSFLHALARSYFSLVPQEALKADYLTWKTYPIGAGPYKITSSAEGGSKVILKKVDRSGAGPDEIVISSKGEALKQELVIGAPADEAAFRLEPSPTANSVTGIYFNYENELGRDIAFRKAIALSIGRAPLVVNVSSYSANPEFLASQFWGRINAKEHQDLAGAQKELTKVKSKIHSDVIRIPVFNSEFGNGNFGKYVLALQGQLRELGLKIEFYKSEKKFFDKTDSKIPFRIISLGADVADPLVLFGLFRKGSPMVPHFPVNDEGFERLYKKAANAEALDAKVIAVRELSSYFQNEVYAVPLFERHGVVAISRTRVRDMGAQHGSLAIYLDRVVMQ